MIELFEYLKFSALPTSMVVVGVILACALVFDKYFGLEPRAETRKATGAAGVLLLVAGLLWMLLGGGSKETILFDGSVAVKCTQAAGQECDQRWSRSLVLEHRGVLVVRYRVPTTHCGPGRFVLFVDGLQIGDTGQLGWHGSALELPLEATIRSDRLAAGSHHLELQGYGIQGGCNQGKMTAHEGDVTITLHG